MEEEFEEVEEVRERGREVREVWVWVCGAGGGW